MTYRIFWFCVVQTGRLVAWGFHLLLVYSLRIICRWCGVVWCVLPTLLYCHVLYYTMLYLLYCTQF